jgi:hypothetical protein
VEIGIEEEDRQKKCWGIEHDPSPNRTGCLLKSLIKLGNHNAVQVRTTATGLPTPAIELQ